MSIASKLDTDCVLALDSATLSYTAGQAEKITQARLIGAIDLFVEEDYEPKVLFIDPTQTSTVRGFEDFIDITTHPVTPMVGGVIGQVAGCQVAVSSRLLGTTTIRSYIVKAGALTLYLKKDTAVETDRDILTKTSVITADKHFAVALADASKVVKAIFLK